LAQHYELGGERMAAARCYERAAAQALEGRDIDAPVERARRGIALGAEGELLGLLRLREADALFWASRHPEAFAAASAALELLPRGSAALLDAVSRWGHAGLRGRR